MKIYSRETSDWLEVESCRGQGHQPTQRMRSGEVQHSPEPPDSWAPEERCQEAT